MLRLPLRTIDDAPESTQGRSGVREEHRLLGIPPDQTSTLIGAEHLEAGDVLFGSKAPF
jgi:hypothetical protein